MPFEPSFDFETYSEAGFVWCPPGIDPKKKNGVWLPLPNAPQNKKGLQVVGASVYTEHPTAEVLTLSYDLTGAGVAKRWKPGDPLPYDLFDHVANGRPIKAHNAMFERLVWENICTPKYGWPEINPYALRCSMATARTNNLPGGLEPLGTVLNVATQKDADGKRLIKKFSIPRNPTLKDPATRILPEDDPIDFENFCLYCDDDIGSEQHCTVAMEPMSADELNFWLIDQEINHRGLGVDRDGMNACLTMVGLVIERYSQECRQLTGGINPSQLQELKGWLQGRKCNMPNMQAETIEMKLKDPLLPPDVRRVLETRALTGSASVKKLYAMSHQLNSDSRLQNLMVHHGARTGRPTGEGPQPLNLPKAGPKLVECGNCDRPHKPELDACPWCGVPTPPVKRKGQWLPEMVPYVLEIIGMGQLDTVEHFFGDAMLAVQGCVRGLFMARDGYELIGSDYSAIEAVVAAVMSGEQWRIDTIKNKIDIYLASASKITGTPLEEYLAYPETHAGDKHPDRQNIGKVAELALGYGGWIGAWRSFDPDEGDKADDDIKPIILAWRDASPNIVGYWGGQRVRGAWGWQDELYGIEGAVIEAIQNPGTEYVARPPSTLDIAEFPIKLRFIVTDDILRMTLPSGRVLKYHEPQLEYSDRRPGTLAISYMTWNSNPKYGPMGWVRMMTWGSRIFENADQAISHDILRFAIINLRAAGYPCVLHVYDEIICEIPIGTGSLEEYERIMMIMPPWAQGWPVRASGGWRDRRFRKG